MNKGAIATGKSELRMTGSAREAAAGRWITKPLSEEHSPVCLSSDHSDKSGSFSRLIMSLRRLRQAVA